MRDSLTNQQSVERVTVDQRKIIEDKRGGFEKREFREKMLVPQFWDVGSGRLWQSQLFDAIFNRNFCSRDRTEEDCIIRIFYELAPFLPQLRIGITEPKKVYGIYENIHPKKC